MAIQIIPQNELPPATSVKIDEFYVNGQINDSGSQWKARLDEMPFEVETGSSLWEFQDDILPTSLQPGEIMFNNATQANTTLIFISKTDVIGNFHDLTAGMVGDQLTVLQNADRGHSFHLTAGVDDRVDYWELPVSHVTNLGSDITKNTRVQVTGTAATAGSAAHVRNAMTQFLGWAFFQDAQYTPGSPLALNAGNSYNSPVKVDGYGPRTNIENWNGTGEWNGASGSMLPGSDNEVIKIQIQMTATTGPGSGVIPLTLQVYLPDTVGVVYKETKAVYQGAGVETSLFWSFELPSSPELFNGGAEFSVSSGSEDVDLYGLEVFFRKCFDV